MLPNLVAECTAVSKFTGGGSIPTDEKQLYGCVISSQTCNFWKETISHIETVLHQASVRPASGGFVNFDFLLYYECK